MGLGKIISREDRTIDTLKDTVRTVYKVLRKTEKYMSIHYDYIEEILPHDIFFITTYELEEMFPDYTPREREYYIAKAKGAVCIMQIGDVLESGEPHDGRAPDYDDWSLNADIIVYYPVLDIALELSSMGIRVDEKALKEQLDKAGCPERAELPFHRAVLKGELPYTIGGGIGQSRICMFFLRKAHIGEVQCSLWPDEVMAEAEKRVFSCYNSSGGENESAEVQISDMTKGYGAPVSGDTPYPDLFHPFLFPKISTGRNSPPNIAVSCTKMLSQRHISSGTARRRRRYNTG